jgi:hypothetical protein
MMRRSNHAALCDMGVNFELFTERSCRTRLSNDLCESTVIEGNADETGETMAAKKKKAAKKGSGDLIISKSRTKGATKKCNVSSDFYSALDKAVRTMIADAEARALGNKRKTLKPVDL